MMLRNRSFKFGIPAALMILGAASSARSAVVFSRDTIIAAGDDVSSGAVKIDLFGSGQVDLAWRGVGGLLYSQVNSAGQIVVDGDTIGSASAVMGIARVNGVVRVGINRSKTIYEYTRQGDGTFTSSNAGVAADRSSQPGGGYDTNPTNGLGGFVYLDANLHFDYVHETSQGVWTSQVLGSTDNYRDAPYPDFVYDSAGNPIVAYKSLNDTTNNLKSGTIGSSVDPVVNANAWYPVAVAVGNDGDIHLLDSTNSSSTNYFSSTDGGATWSSAKLIIDHGEYGDSKDYAIAVSPNGTLAALVYDSSHNLNLAVSVDDGQTWDLQALAGGGIQLPDLGFDSMNNLYVAYYNSTDDKLHLLSTAVAPEPGSLALLAIGAAAMGFRRRRRR
jgi:hypothetical protein